MTEVFPGGECRELPPKLEFRIEPIVYVLWNFLFFVILFSVN